MALLAVLGVCTYGFILKGSDTIFPNVYVAGVNVGGLKRDAAINAVKLAVEQETAADTLTVVLPDRTIEFTPEVTNVALNPDEAADAAMNYGRDGGPIKALITYQKAKKDRQDIALESGKNLDTTYIRDLIDQTARACASEKIDPIVTVDADAKTVTVVTGSPKISLDADKLYDEVVARFESGDFSDLKFDYDTEPCAPVDLQTYYDQFATEMKDAYYDEEKKELVAEKVGFGFDVSYYTQQIAMADAGTTITIQAEEMQPEVTLADLEKEYFADVLGSCDSPHTAQAGRTKNLELACKSIDGTILNPGDEFSFNKIVGERTAEQMKMQIGCVFPPEEEMTMEVKGRSLITGLPELISVSSAEMLEAFEEPVERIMEEVHLVLEKTPPELVADISNNGIVMTGGGSLVRGFDKLVTARTGIHAMVAENAIQCVAEGTGKSLDSIQDMQDGTMNLSRRKQIN